MQNKVHLKIYKKFLLFKSNNIDLFTPEFIKKTEKLDNGTAP
jgi:hypothetical protein